MQCKRTAFFVVNIFVVLTLASCSTYMSEQGGFFSKFNRGQFKEAAAIIKAQSEQEGKDQILFLLDRGTALFEAKDYKGAIEVLSQAEKLTERKDYTSINEEVVSVVTTDNFKKYIPLDYEQIMINTYLALSYYATEDYEGALVECRRINNLVYKLKTKGMNSFEEVPVAWYISATIYEKQKKFDDAFIDYSKVLELKPDFDQAVFDSYRTARFSGNIQAADELNIKYPELDLKTYFNGIKNKKYGAVVVIYFDGEIPIKRQSRSNEMLPEFYTRTFTKSFLTIRDLNGLDIARTSEVLDLEGIARKNLSERVARIVAKRILGIGTQVAIGYGVAKATKSDALGVLAGMLVHAVATPDLRSWSTLPRSFQSARFYLPAGQHKLNFTFDRSSPVEYDIEVKSSDTLILMYRSL